MIQTFSADRTDHALDVSALPWRARRAKNLVDIHDFDLLAELLSVDAITISQQIFRCSVERKGFEHLLRGPFSRGMSRDVEVDNASSIMRENDKHEKNFKPCSMDGEEVDRSQLRYVIVEERSPRLRWRLRTADHVFGDRGLGDLNSKFEQFAVDPRRTPKRILTAHCSNQIASFLWNLGTSGSPVTYFPGPIPPESLTMPVDDGFRLDDEQAGTPSRPDSRQPDPEATVNPREHRSPRLLTSLEHRQLMSQRDDLCLHCSLAAKPDKKGIQHHYYKVEHSRTRLTGHGLQLQQS